MNSSLLSQVFTNADNEVIEYDGSEVSWRVSAYGIVISDEKLLIIKNKLEKLYDVPGGGIEMGEKVEDTLKREGLEEAGVVLIPETLIYHTIDWFYKTSEKKFYQTLQLFYLAEIEGEMTTPTEPEIEKVLWIPIKDLKKYHFLPQVNEALNKVLDK